VARAGLGEAEPRLLCRSHLPNWRFLVQFVNMRPGQNGGFTRCCNLNIGAYKIFSKHEYGMYVLTTSSSGGIISSNRTNPDAFSS